MANNRTYDENEKQTLLETIKTGDYGELRITRIEDSNGVFKAIDIRNWYCTRTDSTMKPTQKGIRIYENDIDTVVNAIKQGSIK